MKKRTTLLVLACLSLAVGAQADNGKVHLRGQLIDMGSTSVTLSYDGASALVGDSRDIMLHTDKDGNFDTTFVVPAPAFYRISRNTLYLSPGDDMTVRITTSNREATFSGRGAEANEYMKYRLFPKGGSYLEAGSNLREDFPKTKALIDSLAAVRRSQLDGLKSVSEEFKRLESARITADVLNSCLCYTSYSSLTADAKNREEMMEKIKTFYQSLTPIAKPLYKELNHDDLLDVAVVRDVMSYVVEPEMEECKAWVEGLAISQRAKELYAAAGKVSAIRSKVDKAVLDSTTAFANELQNRDFAIELMGKIRQAQKLLKGQPAIDFTFNDVDGNPHRLSEYKGKVIYLDFWATWCGPCIQESPYFESLSKEFAGKDIAFIPMSTDSSTRPWLSFIKAHKKELPQFNTVDNTIRSEWAIFYIPRFVVIDKDFNIVDAYAPRPSQPEAKTLLESLL